jgi:hypothetical protein
VYLNPRDKVFLVISQVMGPAGRTEIGEPVKIADAELESQAGAALLRALDSFHSNVYSPETARLSSDKEYRNFRKQHLSVSVERPVSGEVVIIPLHREKGGYTGKRAEQIVLSKDEVPARLASALREAFSVAT